ncbi:CLUMA_CG012254, isoform A [Clunio marinus]|uniref:CLUMA_CG012254, isoform A n=1 Tax=Clunio marinus TaxID=568069 RepID=A0A1J1IGA5_9DIPT|nr:CLUMA_CG012254, isoform A [Clunio marinus]
MIFAENMSITHHKKLTFRKLSSVDHLISIASFIDQLLFEIDFNGRIKFCSLILRSRNEPKQAILRASLPSYANEAKTLTTPSNKKKSCGSIPLHHGLIPISTSLARNYIESTCYAVQQESNQELTTHYFVLIWISMTRK